MAEKTKRTLSSKMKVFLSIIAMLLFIAVSMGVVYLYNYLTATDGTLEVEFTPNPVVTEIPDSSDGIIEYLSDLISKTYDENSVTTDMYQEVSISDVLSSGTTNDTKLLAYILSGIADTIEENYSYFDSEFGNSSGYAINITFTADSTDSVELIQGEYDEDNDDEDDPGSDYYYFTISLPGDSLLDASNDVYYTKAYLMFDDELEDADALSYVQEQISEICEINYMYIECLGGTITATADNTTDELLNLYLERSYQITMEVVFSGEFESVGTVTMSFVYTVDKYYDFTWVGVEFTDSSETIGVGEEVYLDFSAVLSDDASTDDYTISFEISDPERLTVDEEYYAEGLSLGTEPVTVTIIFEYLGNKYTDTIEIYIVESVDKIVISDDKATISIGEQLQLDYTIKPKDATITTVTWYSDDESVATVDENGLVTAVGTGSTSVYVVSDDGLYIDTCVITVE